MPNHDLIVFIYSQNQSCYFLYPLPYLYLDSYYLKFDGVFYLELIFLETSYNLSSAFCFFLYSLFLDTFVAPHS